MELTVVSSSPQTFLTLEMVKEELRITHPQEDEKIKRLIDRCISFFEESTGYFITTRSVRLRFSTKDSLYANKRSERSLGDFYQTRRSYNDYSNFDISNLGFDERLTYLLDFGNLRTQRPISLSITTFRNGEPTVNVFSKEEVDSLTETFFYVHREAPVSFMLNLASSTNKAVVEARISDTYDSDPNVFEMELTTHPPNQVPQGIVLGILRLVTALYESPDTEYKGMDLVISDILQQYDCKANV